MLDLSRGIQRRYHCKSVVVVRAERGCPHFGELGRILERSGA